MQITSTSVGQQSFFISTLGSAKYIPEELSKLTVRQCISERPEIIYMY